MKKLLISILVTSLVLSFANPVSAQFGSTGIAYDLPITGGEIADGHIIFFDANENYVLGKADVQGNVVGVVSISPAVSFRNEDATGSSYPVVSNGTANVLVNGEGGNIAVRDQISISNTAGVGRKYGGTGEVIGFALEPFVATEAAPQGSVLVALDIQFGNAGAGQFNQEAEQTGFRESIMDLFSFSALAARERPSEAFRQLVAGAVLVITVAFSFFTFGRLAKNGIVAFGRNPLAAKLIGIGMALNVIIAVAIVAAGLVVSFLILRF